MVDEQFRRKEQTPALRCISTIELKRAYDVLHHAWAAAQERDTQRLRAAARALAEGQQAPGNAGPHVLTPEERSDFFDNSLEPVALMLLAFAFENLLKALLPQSGGATTTKRRRAEYSHDLSKLADLSGISLTEEERPALAVLSHYSTWAGRYMTPKEMGEYKDRWLHLERGEEPLDAETLQRLYARFYLLAGGGPDIPPDPPK
ncbi:MAG: hypothetical protein ABSH05_15745 [Bryobacteraceae bacterium]|jgi:hypothetical protein